MDDITLAEFGLDEVPGAVVARVQKAVLGPTSQRGREGKRKEGGKALTLASYPC